MIKQLSESVRSHLRSGVAITSVTQCTEELVMNSLDAGATCIAIRVDLPCFKLQVVDNGTGMTQDQLNRVGERYSTSKCHELEDLNKLQYFGYRGEAVASIRDTSAVLEIISRTCLSQQTFCRMFRKGEALSVTGSAVQRPSVGTTVTVHDLFYNLPVRRKAFNEALELERIRYRVEGIALINPGVSFTLRNDVTGHVLLQTKKSRSMLMSFTHLFGTGKAKSLSEVSIVKDDFSVDGFIGKEGHSNKNLQFVFVNSRLVLKTRIHKILNHVLSRSLILKKRGANLDVNSKTQTSEAQASSPTKQGEKYAMFVLNIKCPLDVYDITFDPAKTLVEFKNWPVLTNAIDEMIMSFLRRENLISLSDASSVSPVLPSSVKNQNSTDNDDNKAAQEADENITSESCDTSTENQQSVRDYTNNINTQNTTNCLVSKQVRRPHNISSESDKDVDKHFTSLETSDEGSACQTLEDDSAKSVSSSVSDISENQTKDISSPLSHQSRVVGNHTKSLNSIQVPTPSNISQEDSTPAPHSFVSDSSSLGPCSRKQTENSTSSSPSEQSSADIESVTDVEQCFTKVQDQPRKALWTIDSEDPFPVTMRTKDPAKESNDRFEIIDENLICLPDDTTSSRSTSEQRLRNLRLFTSKPSGISAAQTMSRRLGLTKFNEQNYHKEGFQQPLKSAAQKISERLGFKEKKQISSKLERFKSTNNLSKSSYGHNTAKENVKIKATDIQDKDNSDKSDRITEESSKPGGSKRDLVDIDRNSNNLTSMLPSLSSNKSCFKTSAPGARDPVVPTIADIDLLVSSSETSTRKRFNPFALSTASKLAKLARVSEHSSETSGRKEFLSTVSIVQTGESVLKTLGRKSDPHKSEYNRECNNEVNDSGSSMQMNETCDSRECQNQEVRVATLLGENQSYFVPSLSNDSESNVAETQNIDEAHLITTDSVGMDILAIPKELAAIHERIPIQIQEQPSIPEHQTSVPKEQNTTHTEQIDQNTEQIPMAEEQLTDTEQKYLPRASTKPLPFSVYADTDYAKELERVTILDMSEAESVDSVVLPHVDCYSPVTSDTSTGSLDSSSQSFQPCGLQSQGFSPLHRFYEDDCQSGGFSPRNMEDVRMSQQFSVGECKTVGSSMATSGCDFNNRSSLRTDDEISLSFNNPQNNLTEEQRNVVQEELLSDDGCLVASEEGLKKDDSDTLIDFSLFGSQDKDSISCGQRHSSWSDQPSASDSFPLRSLLPEGSEEMNIQTYDLMQNNNSCKGTSNNEKQVSSKVTTPDILNNEIDPELEKEFECDMPNEIVFTSNITHRDSSVYCGKSCSGVSSPLKMRDQVESGPNPDGGHVSDPMPASPGVLPCSSAVEMTLKKPTWSEVADPRTGRKIYVNSVTGHTLYEEQWKECGYSLQEQQEQQEQQQEQQQDTQMEVEPCSSTGSNHTPLSPTGRENLHSMLNCHLQADSADLQVKWRQPTTSCQTDTSADEANSIEDLFSSWNNPVQDIPHQSCVNAEVSHTSRAASRSYQSLYPTKFTKPMLQSIKSCVNAEVSHTSRAASRSYQSLYPTKFTKPMLQSIKVLGQVDNKFIACVLNTNEKNPAQAPDLIVLFDQHAAHERVRLEQLTEDIYIDSEDVTNCCIKQSTISPPKTLTFTEEEVRLIKSFRDEFKRIGVVFSVSGMSRDSVNIHTIPACLVEREANEVRRGRDSVVMDIAQNLIKEHLEMLRVTGGARNRLPPAIHKVLCSQACHGAIKFGDGLSLDQCKELLDSLSGCDLPFQCAHGRPSIMPLLGLHQLKSKLPAQTTKRPSLWKISKHLPVNQ